MSFPRIPAIVVGVALTIVACSGSATPAPTVPPTPAATAAPTQPPSPTPAPPAPTPAPPAPTPVVTPGPTPSANGIVIRAWTTQALAPQYLFTSLPLLVVTEDGRAITPLAVEAIYPPLLPAAQEQKITPAGVAKLVAAARAAGLLVPDGDFTGGGAMAGAPLAQLTIVADGATYHLSGPTGGNAACTAAQQGCAMPDKGTSNAFAWFWGGLMDAQGWLGSDVAQPAQPYVARGYAILVGPPPNDTQPGNPIGVWPLKDQPLAEFGTPFAISTYRCGTVTGDAAAQLRPVLAKANQLTAWVDDPSQSATRSLLVRPLLPGDGDPCSPAE